MIDIVQKIVDRFKKESETLSIHDGDNGSIFMKLLPDVDYILDELMNIFHDFLDKGELVLAKISSGEFRDMRKVTIEIRGGYIMEYYDYEETSHMYLRLYTLTDRRKIWTALYIDWSRNSPWWR